jgi:hypothetical protein
VALRGAISQRVEGGSQRGSECKSKMDPQVLQEEAAAVMRWWRGGECLLC